MAVLVQVIMPSSDRSARLWSSRATFVWALHLAMVLTEINGKMPTKWVRSIYNPFLFPFSFVWSFRLVVFRSFIVTPCSLFVSVPCFSWWRIVVKIMLFRLGGTPPPGAPCEPEICVFPLRAVFFLAFLMLNCFLFSSRPSPPSLFSISIPIWTSFVSPCLSLWVLCCLLGFGFCCDSFSIRMIYIYLDTYADLAFLFLSEVYDSFQFVCVLPSRICYKFVPEVILIFHSGVIGSCFVTRDCIVAMS